jgi:ABC-2 type transport system ATP-binding protein
MPVITCVGVEYYAQGAIPKEFGLHPASLFVLRGSGAMAVPTHEELDTMATELGIPGGADKLLKSETLAMCVYQLYKKMKVLEVLHFFAALKGNRDGKTDARRWLDELGLGEWGNKKVETLSKGMSQKIQFIASIIARPKLLILDEPFAGLDPVNSEVIKRTVLELRKQGTTILFSTHDMEVAEKMCDYICMMFKGKKVIDGTMDSIQGDYGQNVVRVKIIDGGDMQAQLESLAEVEMVNDFGQVQELRLKPDTDTQSLLGRLMEIGTVRHFELCRPSLRDIFVRIAGPESEEESHE